MKITIEEYSKGTFIQLKNSVRCIVSNDPDYLQNYEKLYKQKVICLMENSLK